MAEPKEVFCEECIHFKPSVFVIECSVPAKSWLSRRDTSTPSKKNFNNQCEDFVARPTAKLGPMDN